MARTFAKYESGLLGGKTKFYLTGTYNLSKKWRGAGDIGQNYWQLNGKLVHYVGNNGCFRSSPMSRIAARWITRTTTKVWVQKLGYNWINFGNWAQSVQAGLACDGLSSYPTVLAPLGPTAADYSNNDACDAGYYGGAGLRKDQIGGISYKQAISDHLTLKVTGYGHHDDGRGLWFTPYVPTIHRHLHKQLCLVCFTDLGTHLGISDQPRRLAGIAGIREWAQQD